MHRMATQKRRVIYLSDEDWAALKARAIRDRQTISAVIRSMLDDEGFDGDVGREFRARMAQPVGRVTAIEAERFNRRPFTPVPKHK
jgi:hypothetical protein